MLSDPRDALAVWESAAGVAPAARGAVLAHRLGHTADLDTALDLSLAACAAISARALVEGYGADLDCVVSCTACGADLEVRVGLGDLDGPDVAEASTEPVHTAVGELSVRAPTTRDLLLAGSSANPAETLLGRCVSTAGPGSVDAQRLGVDDRERVDAACERLSGVAAALLSIDCPVCGATVRAGIDPTALCWQRTEETARRLLADVAVLAGAFGWSESDVLTMSARRRAAYLDLVAP